MLAEPREPLSGAEGELGGPEGPVLSSEEMAEISRDADAARAEEETKSERLDELRKEADKKLGKDREDKESFFGIEYKRKKTKAQIKALKTPSTYPKAFMEGTKVSGGILTMGVIGTLKHLWKETKLISKILWRGAKGIVTGREVKQPTWREMWEEFKDDKKDKKQ